MEDFENEKCDPIKYTRISGTIHAHDDRGIIHVIEVIEHCERTVTVRGDRSEAVSGIEMRTLAGQPVVFDESCDNAYFIIGEFEEVQVIVRD